MTRRRAWLVLGAACATAALQLALAWSWPERDQHVAAVALGWAGALWLSYLRGAAGGLRQPAPAEAIAGIALWAGACCVTVAGHAAYALPARFLPVVAGFGLATAIAGRSALRVFRRELTLLALPIAYPLPFLIQVLFVPTRATAATAALIVRLAGTSVSREGTLLRFPDTTLRVFDACSGLAVISQMLVLAVLLLCFFPTTPRRAAAVVLVGVASGFAVNAARVSLLAVVASRVPSQFDYWEQYVAGSILFPVLAAALAGCAWWLVFRAATAPARITATA